MILASIDIGSNAARLLIMKADPYGTGTNTDFTKLNLVRIPLQLGFDVFETGFISPEKIKMFIQTMQVFKNLMEIYKVEHYRACATSAMRDAKNGSKIKKTIRKKTKIEIDIISGDEEAGILLENHTINTGQQLFIDVGGGSTELTLFNDTAIVAKQSFNVGTIRILNQLNYDDAWQAMKSFVKTHVAQSANLQLVGSGGNINKIFSISKQKEGKPLSRNFIKQLHQNMAPLPIEERIHQFNIREDRANVIVPAMHIYLSVMKWSNCNDILVPKVGLADAIIKKLYFQQIKNTVI